MNATDLYPSALGRLFRSRGIGQVERRTEAADRGRRTPTKYPMKALLASLAVLALLGVSAAEAGSLAPAPRVVAEYDRGFIERSGAQTLEELLDTGIIRYFLMGGQALLVMVDGRPYSTTGGDLEPLPLSAVERIEILGGDSLGTLGAGTLRGVLNIVLRKDLGGFETRAVMRMPSRDGGDGKQGSVFWGGAVGKGRMTLGADIIDRQEIPGRSRVHSRAEWVEGGTFSQAKNVSVSGNTVFVVQLDQDGGRELDENGMPLETRSVALGECDPDKGYVPGLSNPPGITSGDLGCGFAYGNIWWDTSSREQKTAIVDLDHPLGDDAELHLDANLTQYETGFRYAPSVDVFSFIPPSTDSDNNGEPDLLEAINAAAASAGSDFQADVDDWFSVGHRLVGHGNRHWVTEGEEYDISLGVEGRLAEGLGYDAHIGAYRWDSFLTGVNLVHADTIREKIRAGEYDLADPFSDDPVHLAAIRDSRVREEEDSGSESLSAQLALEGSGFAIGGRDAAWTTGVELGRSESHQILRFRGRDGMTHSVTEVLGSGGVSYAGKRTSVAAFGETLLPVVDGLDLRVAGRGAELDDIGGLASWRLGAEYRATDIVTLRGSWSTGESSPSMSHLYSTEVQGHPYVLCDPGAGPPPRTCAAPNPRQVTQELSGNPNLDPVKGERPSFGAEAREGPFFLGGEWYRQSTSDGVGLNTATWAMLNLPECAEGGARENCIERQGGGDITIHRGFENIAESEISGINTRFGAGFRTSWGIVGMRGAWRYVIDAERRYAGVMSRYVIARNAVRVGFLVKRGNLSAIWTANVPRGIREPVGNRRVRVLDRSRHRAGLGRSAGARRRSVLGRRVQSHRHAAYD